MTTDCNGDSEGPRASTHGISASMVYFCTPPDKAGHLPWIAATSNGTRSRPGYVETLVCFIPNGTDVAPFLNAALSAGLYSTMIRGVRKHRKYVDLPTAGAIFECTRPRFCNQRATNEVRRYSMQECGHGSGTTLFRLPLHSIVRIEHTS